MNITAVCTCGERWDVETERTDLATDQLDARVAVLFSADRFNDVRKYNEHVKAKHKKGRA